MHKILGALLISVISFSAHASNSDVKIPSYWKPAFDAAYDRLEKNLRGPNKGNPFFHVHPAPKYPGTYLWDSAFISLIWKNKNPQIAQDVIRSVLNNQEPNGRVPHVVSINGASPWTQPPLLSWAAMDILRSTGDREFAKEIYPKLLAYHKWLWASRRFPKCGLFFWEHPYESGIDNSPRFGARDESFYVDTHKLASVDITSYIIMDAKAIREMAFFLQSMSPSLDLSKDIALLEDHAQTTTDALQKYMWDAKSGYFLDRNVETREFVRIVTVASFFPLAAHAATPEQYQILRKHMLNPAEFNTLIPFPTVSKADPTYEKDMWRGPVWINTSYLVLRGIKEYDDQKLYHYFAFKLVDGVFKTYARLGDFYEFYDPDRTDLTELTRKKGLGKWGLSASPKLSDKFSHLVLKEWILGKKPVNHFMGWTGLANALAAEEFGLK